MNIELFIAKRIIANKSAKKKISTPIVKVAVTSIALGLAVMILSVAIITGFHDEIKNKVIGFGGHIQIVNHDSNNSYEDIPISTKQPFYPSIEKMNGIKHIQVYSTKLGLVKTETDNEAILLKGVGKDFDWTFFQKFLEKGKVFTVKDSVKSNDIVISRFLAQRLKLTIGDDFKVLFIINNEGRARNFKISGIYNTGLESFDEKYALVDIAHIQKLNGWTNDQVSGFEISIDDFGQIDKMGDEVYGIVGNTFSADGSKLKVTTIKEKDPEIFDWLSLLNTNVWVILILMTVVAGVNMISGFLIIILERTKMIGILKAMGATNASVQKIFFYKAIYLISRGLLLGNIIGISICLIQFQFHVFKLDPSSYYVDTVPINLKLIHLLLLNVGTMVITILMLFLPSFIISSLTPSKTIKFD